jgi:hypothetical protein
MLGYAWRVLAGRAVPLAAAVSLLLTGTAHSDGDTRPATAQEKQFETRVWTATDKAIPAAPAGWSVNHPRHEDLKLVSPGSEKHPFRVSWSTAWDDTKRASEEEYAMQMKMVDAVKTTPPDKQLSVMNDIMKAMAPRDVRVRINVSVNNLSESLPPRVVEAPSVAGAPSWHTERDYSAGHGWRETVTWVFLGKGWKYYRDGPYVEVQPAKGVPSLAVQGIVVRIEADAARTKGIIAKIDWASLQGLLQR